MFRVTLPREPAQSFEERVKRLEKRIAYAKELIDETFYRQCELEAAMERAPASSAVRAA